MAYFPIFTQIDGKRCLIAGGGKVAARKVYTLLQYGADVVVMAEKVCGEIKEVLPEENVFEGVFKYIHKNRCNKNEWDIDENKYDTELENTLDKRYSSNSNLKNISYDLEISENLLESLSADLSEDLLKIRKNTLHQNIFSVFRKRFRNKELFVLQSTPFQFPHRNRYKRFHIPRCEAQASGQYSV